jgi:excisionase family DNA binding protein
MCTEANGAVILDTMYVIGSLGTTITGIALTAQEGQTELAGPLMVGGGLVGTALYSGSVVYGVGATKECRELNSEYVSEVHRIARGNREDMDGVLDVDESGEAGEEEAPAGETESEETSAYMSILEAAELCGVEASEIRAALGAGELESKRTDDGQYALKREDVEAFCEGGSG